MNPLRPKKSSERWCVQRASCLSISTRSLKPTCSLLPRIRPCTLEAGYFIWVGSDVESRAFLLHCLPFPLLRHQHQHHPQHPPPPEPQLPPPPHTWPTPTAPTSAFLKGYFKIYLEILSFKFIINLLRLHRPHNKVSGSQVQHQRCFEF